MFATVIGVRHMSGTSKANRQYDMMRAVILRPVESFKNQQTTIEAVGFESVEVDLSPSAFAEFKGQKFPFQCELVTTQEIGRDGIRSIITGFRTPAPLRQSAATA